MSSIKTAVCKLLFLVLLAACGCDRANHQISNSTYFQHEVDLERESVSILKPGTRWTYVNTNGKYLYLESQIGGKIGEIDSVKLRTKGDSLFWTNVHYVHCAEGEVRLIATEYQDWLSIEHPAPVLYRESLAEGQTWNCKSESDDGSSSTDFSAKVLRRESITVAYGTFEVWLVEYTLGFHLGTEYDLRVWFSDEIGIVKIEKWRQSTLGNKKELSEPIVYELTDVERSADAHRIDYPSDPIQIEDLPKNVIAPSGQITLFADFDDEWHNQIVLYLVNRTEERIGVPAQDSDLFIKLEALTADGTWVRAQTHQFSWCGNSNQTLDLEPNTFITLLGFQPANGRKQTARFRCYSSLDITSNVGELVIDDKLIAASKVDRLSEPDNKR